MRRTNLPGHALRSEGKPYVWSTDEGVGWTQPWDKRPAGVALCQCGWTSAELLSDGQRKRAHAEHKEAVINERMEKIRNGR